MSTLAERLRKLLVEIGTPLPAAAEEPRPDPAAEALEAALAPHRSLLERGNTAIERVTPAITLLRTIMVELGTSMGPAPGVPAALVLAHSSVRALLRGDPAALRQVAAFVAQFDHALEAVGLLTEAIEDGQPELIRPEDARGRFFHLTRAAASFKPYPVLAALFWTPPDAEPPANPTPVPPRPAGPALDPYARARRVIVRLGLAMRTIELACALAGDTRTLAPTAPGRRAAEVLAQAMGMSGELRANVEQLLQRYHEARSLLETRGSPRRLASLVAELANAPTRYADAPALGQILAS